MKLGQEKLLLSFVHENRGPQPGNMAAQKEKPRAAVSWAAGGAPQSSARYEVCLGSWKISLDRSIRTPCAFAPEIRHSRPRPRVAASGARQVDWAVRTADAAASFGSR